MVDKYLLPELPYAYDALAPAISEEILKLHHAKHHQAYVNNANKVLEELKSDSDVNYRHLLKDLSFNLNGHILHSAYWENMQPFKDDNSPGEQTANQLSEHFGSLERFKSQFSDSAMQLEGSGWVALLKGPAEDMRLMQIEGHNKLYLAQFSIILIVDVWEHAYYLDYQTDKAKYIEQF